MRCRWRALALLFGAVLWAVPGYANDSAFRGAPADLFPQKQSNEVMESEDILLVGTHAEWRVTAKYVFRTTSKQKVPLQIGFPELRCWNDEAYPCRKAPRFRDMKTLVDGKPVALTEGKLSERAEWASYLGTIWLFDVEFPPEGRVTIEHRYRLESGESSDGDRFVDYVIKTGSLWGGPIGRARFTVRFPAHAFEVQASPVPGFKVTAPRIVDGPEPYVELVAEATALRPTKDLHFRFNSRADRANTSDGIPTFEAVQRDGTAEAVRDRMNLLYAAKGFAFRSSELRARFYADAVSFAPVPKFEGRWTRKLRAFSAFTPDWFAREDREELKWLEKRRDELKLAVDLPGVGPAAPVASAAPAVSVVSAVAATAAAPVTAAGSGEPAPVPLPSAATLGQNAKRQGTCGCDVPGGARRGSTALLALSTLAAFAAQGRRRQRRVSSADRTGF